MTLHHPQCSPPPIHSTSFHQPVKLKSSLPTIKVVSSSSQPTLISLSLTICYTQAFLGTSNCLWFTHPYTHSHLNFSLCTVEPLPHCHAVCVVESVCRPCGVPAWDQLPAAPLCQYWSLVRFSQRSRTSGRFYMYCACMCIYIHIHTRGLKMEFIIKKLVDLFLQV